MPLDQISPDLQKLVWQNFAKEFPLRERDAIFEQVGILVGIVFLENEKKPQPIKNSGATVSIP